MRIVLFWGFGGIETKMEERDQTSKEGKRIPLATAYGGYDDRDLKFPVLFFSCVLGLCCFVLDFFLDSDEEKPGWRRGLQRARNKNEFHWRQPMGVR